MQSEAQRQPPAQRRGQRRLRRMNQERCRSTKGTPAVRMFYSLLQVKQLLDHVLSAFRRIDAIRSRRLSLTQNDRAPNPLR